MQDFIFATLLSLEARGISLEKQPKAPELSQTHHYDGFIHANVLIDRPSVEQEAWALIHDREIPNVPVLQQEREDNARTALMEALTAKGHLSVVRIHGNTVEEINAQVLTRLLNGWDDSLPEHEKGRRFAEICEELTIQKIHRSIIAGDVPPDTEVSAISDFPSALGSLAEYYGYRPSNKKGMIRSTGLIQNEDGTYTRVIEQVSRSNGTWKSTYRLFNEIGIRVENGPADLTALQNLLVYSRQDYRGGVVDVTRMLDNLSGVNVQYGEVNHGNLLAYDRLRQESSRREQQIGGFVEGLAKLEAQLDERVATGQLSYVERQGVYKGEVSRILDAICLLAPEYAEDTFGKKVASTYSRAAVLYAQGSQAEALQAIHDVRHLKGPVTFCGVSITFDEAKALGLMVNSVGDLVESGKDSWQWKMGVCIVKTCPTRPDKTEVGPCSVCRGCQAEFDGMPRRDQTTNVVSIFDFMKKKQQKQDFWEKLVSKKAS